jgi:hypothetical protein
MYLGIVVIPFFSERMGPLSPHPAYNKKGPNPTRLDVLHCGSRCGKGWIAGKPRDYYSDEIVELTAEPTMRSIGK